jgi:hypothetical protein
MPDYIPGEDISTGRLIRLYSRAITGRWGVSEELARKAIGQLEGVLDDHMAEPAHKVAAAKALMNATKLELDEVKLNLDIERASQDDDTDKTIIEIRRVSKDITGRSVGTAPEPEPGES